MHLPEPNALRELHLAQPAAAVERLDPEYMNVDGDENLLQPGFPEAVRTYLLQPPRKVDVPKLFTVEEGCVLQLPQSRGEPHALDLVPLKCPVSQRLKTVIQEHLFQLLTALERVRSDYPQRRRGLDSLYPGIAKAAISDALQDGARLEVHASQLPAVAEGVLLQLRDARRNDYALEPAALEAVLPYRLQLGPFREDHAPEALAVSEGPCPEFHDARRYPYRLDTAAREEAAPDAP